MKLVTDHSAGATVVDVICVACGRRRPLAFNTVMDLDGTPFKSYYCLGCAPSGQAITHPSCAPGCQRFHPLHTFKEVSPMKQLALVLALSCAVALPAAAQRVGRSVSDTPPPPAWCNDSMPAGTPCRFLPHPPVPPCGPNLPAGAVCRWQGGIIGPPAIVCQPGIAAGAPCSWPSDATVLPLRESDGTLARQVAILSGPILIPDFDPNAVRITFHILLSESWYDCPKQQPVASWGVDLIGDSLCPGQVAP